MVRWLVSLLTVAVTRGQFTPDSTSTVSCPEKIAHAGDFLNACELNSNFEGQPTRDVSFSVFQVFAGEGNNVQTAASDKAVQFNFQVLAGNSTGPFQITTKFNTTAFNFTIWEHPDNADLKCPSHELEIDDTFECNVTTLYKGKPCWALSSDLNPGPDDLTFSPFSTDIGTFFKFNVTAPHKTMQTGISGLGNLQPWALTVYGTPDSSTTMVCSPEEPQAGKAIKCTVTPMLNGVQSLVHGDMFNINKTVIPGATTDTTGVTGTANQFQYTVTTLSDDGNPITGIFQLDNGFSKAEIRVWDAPTYADGSLDCPLTTIGVGATVTCTITPKRYNHPIYTKSELFTLACEDLCDFGSGINPPNTVANKFTFPLTVKGTGPIFLTDGTQNMRLTLTGTSPVEPATSVLSCEGSNKMRVLSSVLCTIQTFDSNGERVWSRNSSLTPSGSTDDFGSTGDIVPLVDQNFTFKYTAPNTNGTFNLTVGSVSNVVTFIVFGAAPTEPPTPPPTADDGGLTGGEIAAIVGGSVAAAGLVFCIYQGSKRSADRKPLLVDDDDE